VNILRYSLRLDHIMPGTWPSASHTKQLQENIQQNKTPAKITSVCIVSKDVVQHF